MYDKAELQKGIQHESMHTNDKALATKIAIRHLTEDATYYSKLENSGCGEMDIVPPTISAVKSPFAPTVAIISVGGGSDTQTPLASSGLGKGGTPKPLKSDNLETPAETKKVGPNKVASGKTPPLGGVSSITDTDPMNFFGGQIVSKYE